MNSDLPSNSDTLAQAVLLGLAAWCVWRPAETFSSTAIVVAAVALGLAVWAWRRTPESSNPWVIFAAAGAVLGGSGLLGWDPAAAVIELALIAAIVALAWMASRIPPPERLPALLALAISALSLWGAWQVAWGMDQATSDLAYLPGNLQVAAAERIASGRAFASQLLPSHLAVLLATALPILVYRVKPGRSSIPWAIGSLLCVVGLALARSPVGIALALLACAALAVRKKRGALIWLLIVLTVVLAIVIGARGDVLELEPVRLRVDNWRTATWVWSGSPAAGVGLGGFAQAAQAVPFEVGNSPRHAHSLLLEWFAELGPAGLLAGVFLAIALFGLLRKLWAERPELAASLAVIPAHNLIDFSLYGSGVALAWAVLLGWGLAYVRGNADSDNPPAAGRTVFVAVVAAMLAVVVFHVTSITVQDFAAIRKSPRERYETACQALRLAPWRVDPIGLIADAALDTGEAAVVDEALSELEEHRWLRPRSAALAALCSRLAIALEDAPTAAAEAWTASSDRPRSRTYAENFETLVRQLDGERHDVAP
ncbi:MAG: hypothetical protein LJE93_01720 [Acidobacteria bacterium]|jgi:O-antigen ligase|nr:hypothetical protein [Acidobacteriota bacterium]